MFLSQMFLSFFPFSLSLSLKTNKIIYTFKKMISGTETSRSGMGACDSKAQITWVQGQVPVSHHLICSFSDNWERQCLLPDQCGGSIIAFEISKTQISSFPKPCLSNLSNGSNDTTFLGLLERIHNTCEACDTKLSGNLTKSYFSSCSSVP